MKKRIGYLLLAILLVLCTALLFGCFVETPSGTTTAPSGTSEPVSSSAETSTPTSESAESVPSGEPDEPDEPTACVHTPVIDAAVAATCTTAGKTAGSHCSKCGEVLVVQETIASLHQTLTYESACSDCEKTPTAGLAFALLADESGYSVSKGAATDSDILIPMIYEGKPVKSVGEDAFYNCDSLMSITIPMSMTSIGESAFRDCDSLTSITIPASVTSIGETAFSDCDSLTMVTFAERSQCTEMGLGVFASCRNLKMVTLAMGLTEVGASAFKYCWNLSMITIPESVTSIARNAFEGCTKLIEVENLSALNITAGSAGNEDNGGVGTYAKNIYTASSGSSKLSYIGDYQFYIDGEEIYLMGYHGEADTLVLPESYNGSGYVIYSNAFIYSSNLTSVTFASGSQCSAIGEGAFQSCTDLTTITIPASVKNIYGNAFGDCADLATVTFAEGSQCETIGESAFDSCQKLTAITIPASVTRIGAYAFHYCSVLATVTFAEGSQCEMIGESAFDGCELTAITIPASVTRIGAYAFNYCATLETVTFAEGSQCETIGESAFENCWCLTAVTIPASVTRIDTHAFYDCDGLMAVTFSVTEGWYYEGQTAMDVANAENNAANLTTNYVGCWTRNVTAS